MNATRHDAGGFVQIASAEAGACCVKRSYWYTESSVKPSCFITSGYRAHSRQKFFLIALAWLLAQKPWIVPIPGTTKLSRLDENNGSLAIKFTSDDLREIDGAASKIRVQGDRYPERVLRMSGR
jgi:hypothetical protein